MEPETGELGFVLFISDQDLLLLGQMPMAAHTCDFPTQQANHTLRTPR